MRIKTFVVDAFTDKPFKGNPAGVCLLNEPLNDSVMQQIATEINASETAFLIRDNSVENHFHIRYFSPAVEIDFCGHASVASTKVLFHLHTFSSLKLITGKGLELNAVANGGKVIIQFPLYHLINYPVSTGLLEAIGLKSHGVIGFARELSMLLIETEDLEVLNNLSPDFNAMVKADRNIKEVVVTAISNNDDFDFYSRCFCPWIGIDEDPVTGAAHSVLAPFWQQKLNKRNFRAYQCSKRGGELNLKITEHNTLEVLADATIVFEGDIII